MLRSTYRKFGELFSTVIFCRHIFSYFLILFFWFCRPIKQDVDEPDSKKIKKEEKVDGEAKKLEEIIAKQNKEYFKIRDKLKAHTNKKNWIEILHRNKQAVPEGNSEVSTFDEKNHSLTRKKKKITRVL